MVYLGLSWLLFVCLVFVVGVGLSLLVSVTLTFCLVRVGLSWLVLATLGYSWIGLVCLG